MELMEIGNAGELKSKRSLGTRQSKERKSFKFPVRAVPTQEDHDSLKAMVGKLKQETCRLSRQLRKHANRCMELRDANRLLLDELKKMCEPCVMQVLEAKNPDNNPQTESHE